MALAMISMRSPDAANSTKPIGGAASPTVKFTGIITAKCPGCTPRSGNIGPETGPRTVIAGADAAGRCHDFDANFAAMARNLNFCTLPVEVFGRSVNTTVRGAL